MSDAPAPVPPPHRHGVDLVHVPRLRDTMGRNEAFETRVFTEGERAYCRRRRDPFPHFAARFAAKEATLKALGLGLTAEGVGAALREVEVVREGGPPRLLLHGKPDRIAEREGLTSWTVSLSHDGEYAMASVILWGAPAAGRSEDA